MKDKTDVTNLPLAELLSDLRESMNDLRWCQLALQNQVFEYGPTGASVASRFLGNVNQQRIIAEELSRRFTEAYQAIQTPSGKSPELHILDVLALKPDCQALRYLQGLDLAMTDTDVLIYTLGMQG